MAQSNKTPNAVRPSDDNGGMSKTYRIAPSILSADFARLGDDAFDLIAQSSEIGRQNAWGDS